MTITVARADYADSAHAKAIVSLLDVYARDPMGGGTPLPDDVRARLVPGLAARPHFFSLLAFSEEETPVGLANCMHGYSSFAAQALINIHDMVVLPEWRGRGVSHALFDAIDAIAQAEGACKVTLEVLSGNARAKAFYAKRGFGDYLLDPAMGNALFWQKRLAA
jgi:GNAT superfamily N-acetyltransferase